MLIVRDKSFIWARVMSTVEAAVNWISQNLIPFVIVIVTTAVGEILFRIFVWDEYVAPSFKHRINLFKKRVGRGVHNTSIHLSYNSRTVGLETRNIGKDHIKDIARYLKQRKIDVSEKGDLIIESYRFGKLELSGRIEFTTDDFEGSQSQVLQDLDISLQTQVRYNSLNDDITGILQAIGKIKEYVSLALGVPMEYQDSLSCTLTNLVVELTEAMKDLSIEYIKFGGRADVSMYKDKVVFNAPLDTSTILPTLRKLVVLYA